MSAQRGALTQNVVAAWPTIAKIATAAVVMFVIYLLVRLGMGIDWAAVLEAADAISARTFVMALVLVLVGYSLYSGFDLLAKQFTHHHLPNWKVVGVAAMSYAMNLSLGVIVGGIAMRLRIYRRLHVRPGVAFQVVLFSTATNWIGYFWLAGGLFVSGLLPVPEGWHMGASAVQLLGAALLLLASGYVALCAWSGRRHWKVRGHPITLPSGRMALAQSGLAILSWMTMGCIVYIFLERGVDYAEVLAILLFSGIAALMAHIPGGLGVTEAIFVTALSGRMPDHQVLAAVLMYRMVYALVPLAIALVAYLITEVRAGRKPVPDPNPTPTPRRAS